VEGLLVTELGGTPPGPADDNSKFGESVPLTVLLHLLPVKKDPYTYMTPSKGSTNDKNQQSTHHTTPTKQTRPV